MADALLGNREGPEKSSIMERLHLDSRKYLLITLHSAADTDVRSNLDELVTVLCGLGERVVFPVHPRPEKQLRTFGLYDRLSSGVEVMSPLEIWTSADSSLMPVRFLPIQAASRKRLTF
jgi:UDP-N-acetylglucosamine 2-epimerase (non-hydrolysing)